MKHSCHMHVVRLCSLVQELQLTFSRYQMKSGYVFYDFSAVSESCTCMMSKQRIAPVQHQYHIDKTDTVSQNTYHSMLCVTLGKFRNML